MVAAYAEATRVKPTWWLDRGMGPTLIDKPIKEQNKMAMLLSDLDMDIRKLEVFTAVVEERSFTRAAVRLRTAQSAVSTAIRALERDLGATLLDRTTQRVELTDAGRALLPEAQGILAAVESAREVVTQVGQGLRGRLRLGL